MFEIFCILFFTHHIVFVVHIWNIKFTTVAFFIWYKSFLKSLRNNIILNEPLDYNMWLENIFDPSILPPIV